MKKPNADRQALHVEADPAFQRRTWLIQRIGWGLFAMLILAALAGLFGSGPLSRTESGAPESGLQVEYDRFARLHAPTTVVIRADRRPARGDDLAIVLSGAMHREFELSSTMPPSDGASVAPDSAILTFRTDRQSGELTIVLHVKPQQVGMAASRIGIAGGPTHTIRQWIYP
jgi:hypothetical protein